MSQIRFVLTADGVYKNTSPQKINYSGYIQKRNKQDQKFYDERMKVLENYFVSLLEPLIINYSKSLKRKLKILDVGCGDGLILKSIYRVGKKNNMKIDLYGLDLDKDAMKKIKIPSKLTFSSMTKIPFDNDTFDLVTCSQTLEHVSLRDIKITLKEVHRVLLPNGFFYLETPNPDSFLAKVMGKEWWMFLPEHITLIPPRVISKLLNQAGFKKSYGKTRLEIDSQMDEIREIILRKKFFIDVFTVKIKYILIKFFTHTLDKGSITVGIAQK